MADIVNEQGKEPEVSKEDMEKLESVKKADAAVKSMHDFTSPEVLYNELIASIKKYHPSTDITMIQKAYETAREAHKESPGNPTLFILYVLPLFWRIWNWIRKPL